jgi:AraC-like DNA-binding protein
MTRLACGRARLAGIDLQPILRRAHLTLREIEDEKTELRVTTQINCLNQIAEALGDRLLGFHLLEKLDLRRLGFIHYVVASSENLGAALGRAARYSSIVNEGVRLQTDLGRTLRVGIEYAGVSRLSDRQQIEAWIAAIVRSCRQITGRELQPLHIRIMHQRIAESGELDNFLGRSVEFGADVDEIVFSGEAAGLPVVGADPYLNALLTRYCDEALARHQHPIGELRTNVENTLARLLPHAQGDVENVAQKLRISPRTLRRKLAEEGVTFAGIREDLRLALAKRYLKEQDLSISRIAWLLGYTEVSAFSHAFRRWTGRTPRADRPRQRRPDHSVRPRRLGRP